MPLTLEQSCIVWADQHWPECHASMSKGDRRHYLKCLGAVVRRRATAEPSWLWGWIARDSQQVLTLSPYIGRFTDNARCGRGEQFLNRVDDTHVQPVARLHEGERGL
jgi:hypothetical protein